MSRQEIVRQYVNALIEALPQCDRGKAYIHTYGVAECCALICKRRDLDAELGLVCGLLHEIYYYDQGTYEAHAEKGALMAARFMEETALFSPKEVELIKNAIHNHDFAMLFQGPYDEALKDADAFAPFLQRAMENPNERVKKVFAELGFSCHF